MANRKPPADCWVDLFELPLFQGRMRRLFGPGDFSAAIRERGRRTAASMIVGPAASVICRLRTAGPDEPSLRPRGVIPDLRRLTAGREIHSIQILKNDSSD